MNQLGLSTDLNVITAEINSYKQIAGQAVFEIGKRLKYVKENDLVHGEFGEWVKDSFGFHATTASRLIASFEQFGELATSLNMDSSKIFEMLSLPESVDRAEFISEPHTIPSTGESKKIEEMTVRELREVKRSLKEAERAKEDAELSARQVQAQYNLAINQHSEQQDKLLEQIDQLKKSKINDSPETLKRIAELEAEVKKARDVSEENAKLNQAIDHLKEEMKSKVTQVDESQHAIRNLRGALRNMLVSINTEQTNAGYFYSLIRGHKEAHEAVQVFLHDLDREMRKVFDHWTNESEFKPGEGDAKYDSGSISTRTRTIIDVVE